MVVLANNVGFMMSQLGLVSIDGCSSQAQGYVYWTPQ